MSSVSVIAVIPARYASSRLPGKALADIAGVPMIVRVWRQTSKARLLQRVFVATDDQRIADAVIAAGGEVQMTAASHLSGTDRIAEVAGRTSADIYVNVQGDQPFIAPTDVDAVAQVMAADETISMATLAAPITDANEWHNPNKVKIVCDKRGDALYFSRCPIPFFRDSVEVPPGALRHVAVYGYRREFLLKFAALEAGTLEQIEKLEQLRAMENGYRITVVRASAPSLEVDTAEDLALADAAARRDQQG